MLLVGTVLAGKTLHDVCTISAAAPVFDAVRMFAEQNLGALIVVEEANVVGLISERDYARKVVLMGRSSRSTSVKEVMSMNVICVTPETTLDECMAIMINKYIRHLPVIDKNQLVGIVSMGDVVKAALGEKDFLIDELVHYITDSPMVRQQAQQSQGAH